MEGYWNDCINIAQYEYDTCKYRCPDDSLGLQRTRKGCRRQSQKPKTMNVPTKNEKRELALMITLTNTRASYILKLDGALARYAQDLPVIALKEMTT